MNTPGPIGDAVRQQASGGRRPRVHDPRIGESLYGDADGHWARLITRTGHDWIIPPALELTVGPVGAKRQAELTYLGETCDALPTLYQRLKRYQRLERQGVPGLQAFLGQRLGLSQTAVSAHICRKIAAPNLRTEAWSVLVQDLIDSRHW